MYLMQIIPESTIDLQKIFESCPLIYSLLMGMSFVSFIIWLYSLFTIKRSNLMPKKFFNKIRSLLNEKHYEEALALCRNDKHFSANILASGIAARKHGPQVMIASMESEGKRCTSKLWQRISLLNEIATIAPMLGLLGTVIGLFFAFYDVNRSAESLTSIFDGLGIAVGTTVMGLIVAILAMLFYTSLKFRVINLLNRIENETASLMSSIEIDHP